VTECPAPGALEVALPRTAPLPTQGNRLIRGLLIPAIAVALLLGSVPVGAALGYWQTTGQVISTLDGATTEDIKGSSTLRQVSAAFDIPLDDLYALLGLPGDIAPDTKLKDLESYNEVSTVRTLIGTWVAEH
jgi:hypothetical protein